MQILCGHDHKLNVFLKLEMNKSSVETIEFNTNSIRQPKPTHYAKFRFLDGCAFKPTNPHSGCTKPLYGIGPFEWVTDSKRI